MRASALVFLTAVFLLTTQRAAAQSPWTRSQSGLYAQAAWHFIPSYTTLFSENPDQDRAIDRETSEGTFQLYGEYGITARATAIVALPVRLVQTADESLADNPIPSGSLTGLGNVSLGLRYRLLGKRMPVSATLRVDLPAADRDEPDGLRTGYPAFAAVPMLSTGMGFGRAYWYAYAGYGFRGGGYSHFALAGAEAGYRVGPVWVAAFSEWQPTLKNGDVEIPFANARTGLFVDRQGYWSIGFKGIAEINRFLGVFLTAAGAFDAENLPKSPGLGAGVFFKWQ